MRHQPAGSAKRPRQANTSVATTETRTAQPQTTAVVVLPSNSKTTKKKKQHTETQKVSSPPSASFASVPSSNTDRPPLVYGGKSTLQQASVANFSLTPFSLPAVSSALLNDIQMSFKKARVYHLQCKELPETNMAETSDSDGIALQYASSSCARSFADVEYAYRSCLQHIDAYYRWCAEQYDSYCNLHQKHLLHQRSEGVPYKKNGNAEATTMTLLTREAFGAAFFQHNDEVETTHKKCADLLALILCQTGRTRHTAPAESPGTNMKTNHSNSEIASTGLPTQCGSKNVPTPATAAPLLLKRKYKVKLSDSILNYPPPPPEDTDDSGSAPSAAVNREQQSQPRAGTLSDVSKKVTSTSLVPGHYPELFLIVDNVLPTVCAQTPPVHSPAPLGSPDGDDHTHRGDAQHCHNQLRHDHGGGGVAEPIYERLYDALAPPTMLNTTGYGQHTAGDYWRYHGYTSGGEEVVVAPDIGCTTPTDAVSSADSIVGDTTDAERRKLKMELERIQRTAIDPSPYFSYVYSVPREYLVHEAISQLTTQKTQHHSDSEAASSSQSSLTSPPRASMTQKCSINSRKTTTSDEKNGADSNLALLLGYDVGPEKQINDNLSLLLGTSLAPTLAHSHHQTHHSITAPKNAAAVPDAHIAAKSSCAPSLPSTSPLPSSSEYFPPLPERGSPMDYIIRAVVMAAAKCFGPERIQGVRTAEVWAHNRPHTTGHQLHFDSDNEGLKGGVGGKLDEIVMRSTTSPTQTSRDVVREVNAEEQSKEEYHVRHPTVGSIFYLSPPHVGGPTLITDQQLADARLGSHGWLIHPRENRLAVFDGCRLHGVVPGKGAAPATSVQSLTPDRSSDQHTIKDRRVTVMCALWDDISVRRTRACPDYATYLQLQAQQKAEKSVHPVDQVNSVPWGSARVPPGYSMQSGTGSGDSDSPTPLWVQQLVNAAPTSFSHDSNETKNIYSFTNSWQEATVTKVDRVWEDVATGQSRDGFPLPCYDQVFQGF